MTHGSHMKWQSGLVKSVKREVKEYLDLQCASLDSRAKVKFLLAEVSRCAEDATSLARLYRARARKRAFVLVFPAYGGRGCV